MKKFILAAAFAAAAAFAGPAFAQDTGAYATAGYARANGDGADLDAFQARLGYNFHPNFGVEGEIATGVGDDNGVKLSDEYGVFGVAKVAVTPQIDLFARAGVARAEFKNAPDDDGGAYGVGAQWNVNDRFGVRADYTRYGFAGDADVWGLSGVVKF